MNTPLTPRERANTNPEDTCQHGRKIPGHCTICAYEYMDAHPVSEVPC